MSRVGSSSPFVGLLALVLLAACGTGGGTGPEVRALPGGDRTVFVGETVDLDGSASRPDDGSLAYAWTIAERPAGSEAALDDPEAARTSFVADVEGRYAVDLAVRHDAGSDTARVRIDAELAAAVRLEGNPSDPALGATYDLHVPAFYAEDAYVPDTEDDRDAVVLLREIEVAFVVEATVGEVNDLLDDLGGGIVSMLAGVPIVVVQIPDPGDLAVLRTLLADLEADPRVEAAFASYVVEETEPETLSEEEEGQLTALDPAALPPDADPTDQARMFRNDHHLAVRGHAAWNARAAMAPLADRPWIVIHDSFGDDTPTDGYDLVLQDGDFGDGNASRHGYHVLGILGGAFDPPNSVSSERRSDVTGMAAGRLQVRAVDNRGGDANTWPRRTNLVIQRINAILDGDPDANLVVTSSQNSRSLGQRGIESQGAGWIVKVRLAGERVTLGNILNLIRTEGSGRESRFVHTTSAGNASSDGSGGLNRWPAVNNSVYAYAGLADDASLYGVALPPLTNVHVIENRRHARYGGANAARPAPQCVTNGSIVGGTLGAPGVGIWSMGRCAATDAAGNCLGTDGQDASFIGGTSMSTPQVAGLAAFAWSLDPSLTAAEVVALLADTAVDDGITAGNNCHPTVTDPAPVIDAYAMIVRAGGNAAWHAILDVDDDGWFGGDDVDGWLVAWSDAGTNRDYGRFDLNGDGGIGAENRTERVDLNGDGAYGTATRSIGTSTVSYDENGVSDLDVLCYHAHSSLFDGSFSPPQLASLCGDAVVEILEPADGSVQSTGTVDLRARMRTYRPDGFTPDPSLYRISWYEVLNTGDRNYLGTTDDGDLLTADVLCADATLVARAQHRNAFRTSEDAVAVSRSGARPTVWEPSATPEASTVYLSVNTSGSVELIGSFQRFGCDGAESMATSSMGWIDLDDGSLAASGATLTVSHTDLSGGPKRYELRSTLARSGTLTRTVAPCSVFADFGSDGGLPPCSNPIFEELFGDAVGRNYEDIEEALRIKEWLDRNFEDRFGPSGPPDPFFDEFGPLRDAIVAELGGADGEIVGSWFGRLFDILTMPEPATWVDDVRALEATVLEEAETYTASPWESWFELFLGATRTVLNTYDLYAPVELGGRDVAAGMAFLVPEERALLRQGLEPARLAVRAHLTSFLATHASPDGGGLGAYDTELAIESGVVGGLGGALQVTGFLDPAWPHD